MDIYNALNEDLKTHVQKIFFTHEVLSELKEKSKHPRMTCENCIFHGFPCLNCSYYVYNGELGPGHCCGDRVHFVNETFEEDETSNFNSLVYILMKNPPVRIADNLHSMHLPQYDTYIEMHANEF